MIFKRILINNFGGLREKRHRIDIRSKCALWNEMKQKRILCLSFCEEHVLWSAEEMQEKNGIYEKAGTEASGKNMVELYGFSTMEKITA